VKPLLRNSFLWKLVLLLAAITLFVLSYIFNTIYTDNTSVETERQNAEEYVAEKQNDFNSFLEDTSLLVRLINSTESEKEFNDIVEKNYGIFLYTVDNQGTLSMNFWSSQLVLPPSNTYAMGEFETYQKMSNGYYVIAKKFVRAGEYTMVAYAVIPIQSNFFLEAANLPDKFFFSKTADKRVSLSNHNTETPFAVKSLSGKTLFYLTKKETGAVSYNSKLTLILRLGGIAFLLLFIHLLAESIARRKKVWASIAFLGIMLLAIRVVTYLFPALLNLRQFELFDPTIYGSNIIQRTLGDLLFNSIFFCWFVLFAWSKVSQIELIGNRLPLWLRWIVGIISLCLLIYSTFIISSVIRSIVADSKISFDVTDFSSLTIYTAVGFIVLACLSLSYYYFTQLLFRVIFPLFKSNTWPIYFAIGFAGLVYLTARSGDPAVLFYIPVLAWLLIYTLLVNRRGLIFHNLRINIAGILFWIFVFSVSIAAIMLDENESAELSRRKLYAEKMGDQTDPTTERLMSIAIAYLDSDFLTNNFYRLKDSLGNRYIKDSIIAKSDIEKYNTRLYAYDSLNRPLFNEDPAPYETLNSIITMQAKPTGTPDLYYYANSFDKFTYIARKPVKDTNDLAIGSLFIVSSLKKYSGDALFPVLFKEYKKNDPENSTIYFYAIYNKKQLTNRSDKYPFSTRLTDGQIPKETTERKNNGDYDELWYRAGNEKIVVLARKRDTIIESITLFSWIFCSFLLLISLVQLISLILKTGYNWEGFRKLFQTNIRTQVHNTIIFISIFSFIIIGVATISFFINRYNRTNKDKLSRAMVIMINEMQKKNTEHKMFDDVLPIYDSVSNQGLQNLVNEMSDIHGVDVNVYDLNGDLKVSSAPTFYDRGVLSKKINPTAFYHVNRLSQVEWVQNETIGDFTYLSIYAPVRDEKNGQVYAYLSIPYFSSQQELNQEISNFIVTVINLNAFIFLIAGLIALFITNRITRSFSIISAKMKDVNLGRMNEAIIWNRNDEIGELVQEYNKMVGKLEESAAALAKTEREGAWREMARQVAHEIKNPLTPMKLSIQYLQKAIDSNQPNVKELSSNVANTLVEQIDHLAKIAADFSQFANIGNINAEKFDLHEVIRSLKDLYQSDENVDFVWEPVHRELMIEADKTQMNRLFTNLFANAVEASNGNCRIEVKEEVFDSSVRINIKDFGEGIAPEMQSRIFIPNFTTKTSGTGLGLAMCKGIIEQAKGKIWFETEKGKGTTFHVELPMAN
jgi:two-component system, NtrC family, nitrogen regulation sensor histidine kinase NtrY